MLVTQSCLTLYDPVDCSPPGNSVHGILQARILEWVAIPFSRELPDQGIKPRSPAMRADSLPSEPPGKCFELAVSNIGWRLLNWNDILCKGSALSKSYFLLWKRYVVELNDVYLNISFEWLYYPFSPTLSWFWSYKTSLLEISILWCEYFWISIIGEAIWGKAQNLYGRQKKGGGLKDTLFSVLNG